MLCLQNSILGPHTVAVLEDPEHTAVIIKQSGSSVQNKKQNSSNNAKKSINNSK